MNWIQELRILVCKHMTIMNEISTSTELIYGSAICKLSIVPLVFRRWLHDRFATVERGAM